MCAIACDKRLAWGASRAFPRTAELRIASACPHRRRRSQPAAALSGVLCYAEVRAASHRPLSSGYDLEGGADGQDCPPPTGAWHIPDRTSCLSGMQEWHRQAAACAPHGSVRLGLRSQSLCEGFSSLEFSLCFSLCPTLSLTLSLSLFQSLSLSCSILLLPGRLRV